MVDNESKYNKIYVEIEELYNNTEIDFVGSLISYLKENNLYDRILSNTFYEVITIDFSTSMFENPNMFSNKIVKEYRFYDSLISSEEDNYENDKKQYSPSEVIEQRFATMEEIDNLIRTKLQMIFLIVVLLNVDLCEVKNITLDSTIKM